MPTKKIESSQEIYQLKVTLFGTRPPIWRRLLVPASMTLVQLHHVLQAAMGWEDCHLHEFRIGRQRFGAPDPMEQFVGRGTGCISEKKVRLSEVLNKRGAKAEYTYDFGDSWEHSIIVEKVLPSEPGLVAPVCTAGERNGPPEDCGGVVGFYNFLEVIRDPSHDQHQELLDWIGGSFDPESFSPDVINHRLDKMFRPLARLAPAAPARKPAVANSCRVFHLADRRVKKPIEALYPYSPWILNSPEGPTRPLSISCMWRSSPKPAWRRSSTK
jgi:Plasmid pRiA4b ORF-3-like protein